MPLVQLTITELDNAVPKMLYGLKINEDTLINKGVAIDDIPLMLGITESYAIGYDSMLSKTQQPHYHLHWLDKRGLACMQKVKQRAMPDWGRTTKMYPAKIKEGSDPYAWYGYACKEQTKILSTDLDPEQVRLHAHTQNEFKKAKINYVEKKEQKVKDKLTFEEEMFKYLDTQLLSNFVQVATAIAHWHHKEHNKWITRSPLEMYAWKWCVSRGHFTYERYTRHLLRENYNEDSFNFFSHH